MKATLKFCHNFQNRVGCFRSDCTYLHVSKREHSSFLESGLIPKVLEDRYAAMSGKANPGISAGECSSKVPRVITPASSVAHTLSNGHPPVSTLLLQPPPPLTKSVTGRPQHSCSSTNSAMAPNSSKKQPNHQISVITPMFDASKPPPSISKPVTMSQKRKTSTPNEVAPCKASKPEESDSTEKICDVCVQRQIRTEMYRQDLQKGQQEKEYKINLLEKKTENYEHKKLLMRSLVDTDMYQLLEKYVEEGPSSMAQLQDVSQLSSVHSLTAGSSTSSKPNTRQLLDHVLENGSKNQLDAIQSLTRPKAASARKDTTAETFQTLLDLMCGRRIAGVPNGISESRTNHSEGLNSSSTFNGVISGFAQIINTHNGNSPSPELNLSINSMSTISTQNIPSTSYNIPVSIPHNASISSPPPNFVPFQPNIPPPSTKSMQSPPLNTVSSSTANTNSINCTVLKTASPLTTTSAPTPGLSTSQQSAQSTVRFPGTFPMPQHQHPTFK